MGSTQARGLRTASIPTKIRLTYYQEQSLKVELQYQTIDEWIDCFETRPIKLPSLAYLGFSAETGELHDNHDILAVETWNMHVRDTTADASKIDSTLRAQSQGKSFAPGINPTESRGWGWFFIKVVLFLVVVVGGYVGFTMYRTSRRSSRF